MTSTRVVNFLKNIVMTEYIEVFEAKNIDYETIFALRTFPDVISQIIPNVRDQIKLRLSLDSICELNKDVPEKPDVDTSVPAMVWEEDNRKELSKLKRKRYLIPETQQNDVQVEENVDLTEYVWEQICLEAGVGNTVETENVEDGSSLTITNPQVVSKLKKRRHLVPESHQNNDQIERSDNLVEFEWQQICIESTVGNAVENTDVVDVGSQITVVQQENYIYKALQGTPIGKAILGYYKKGIFDNTCRNELTKQIIYAEYGTDLNTIISTKRFVKLAELIVECIPGEHTETYYIPSYERGKGRSASGKLYDSYCNFNKYLRVGGLRNTNSAHSNRWLEERTSVPPATNSEQLQQKLDFLNTYLKPWEEIKKCWEATSVLRMQKLRDGDNCDFKLSDYVRKFPILSEPGSHVLLEYDFEVLFPQAAKKWQLKWYSFSQKLKQELKTHGLDKRSLDCDAAIFYHFPLLFCVRTVSVPKQKPWRVSKGEVQEGFLVHIKDIGDYEKKLERMRNTARSRGTDLKPVPFIVGESLENITASYVALDGKLLQVESPSRAVEITFKMYHSLNCNYPIQSARPWTVLGRAIFDIQEKADTCITPDVMRLIKILS